MKKEIFIVLSILLMAGMGAASALAQTSSDRIVITWTASNFHPSRFEGKVLPTFGSPVTVSVEATRNGVIVDLSQADIAWELDGKFLAGGRNVKGARFTASKGGGNTHFIAVKISRAGELFETSTRIPVGLPAVAIDAPYPSGEGAGGSMTLYAIPFFFNVASLSDLSFSWLVDGERLAAGNDHALTISSEGILNPRTFRVALDAANTQDPSETANRRSTFILLP